MITGSDERAPTPVRRLDWGQLFFSSAGRLGRGAFLGAIAVLLAVFALYDIALWGPARWLFGWLIGLVLLFAASCVLSKRFHDRGRSGWWSAIVLLAFVVVWPRPDGLIDFLFGLVLIWAAVELCVMRGEEGANRFGRPPGA